MNITVNLVSVLRSQEPQRISLFSGIKTNLSRGKIPDTFLVAWHDDLTLFLHET